MGREAIAGWLAYPTCGVQAISLRENVLEN